VRAKNPYKKADSFTQAAKKQGFPARSVFKLEEIDRRCHLLKQGQKVVDLGAAPGSWSLFVQRKIGANGRLVAVDRLPLNATLGFNARFHQADLFELGDDAFLAEAPFDVVLSDMAPNTSGMREADQWGSFELVMKAKEIADRFAKRGSSFVAKIFMGPDYEQARAALREAYSEVRTLRPEPVRKNSIEVFFVATGKKLDPTSVAASP
jgi:23S rRNA (uridine2552-2'-O)-methyltransferase